VLHFRCGMRAGIAIVVLVALAACGQVRGGGALAPVSDSGLDTGSRAASSTTASRTASGTSAAATSTGSVLTTTGPSTGTVGSTAATMSATASSLSASSGCAPPATLCPFDGGTCADLASDPDNCGGCGLACAVPNATTACSDGACVLVECNPGFADCTGCPECGCETNIQSVDNCGSCGNVCAAGAHATAVCEGGQCHLACDPGFADCSSCEECGCVDNCGACGNVCVSDAGPPGCVTGCVLLADTGG
jgi:hypothetical protein